MMASVQPGDVVWTAYGAGVVVGEEKAESSVVSFWKVRLWRIPGKSIASSSLAYVQPSVILETIPAAPGMVTKMKKTQVSPDAAESKIESETLDVLVHSYNHETRVFLVSEVDNPASIHPLEFQYVHADDMIPRAPSAKIYPILEALLHRAEETAERTRHLLQSEQAKEWADKTGRAVEETAGKLIRVGEEKSDQPAAVMNQLKTAAQDVAPAADETLHKVLDIMKDEQLTDLLGTCRERLKELLQTTDVSAVTEQALAKTGIKIKLDGAAGSLDKSRRAALESIDKLLQQAEVGSLENVQKELASNFLAAFDNLSNAAKSDRGLDELFRTLSEKTTEWQQATGRLLQTRSASLFLEGASRLQARAASILTRHGHLDWAGEIGNRLTKSFTEGDAAVARLKSIELGEAVKTKLIEAIEVRSESLGGLDGIIAGALAAAETKQKALSGEHKPIQNLLSSLQANASDATSDARETLISVLSSRSKYRESVLIRLETVLCHLEHHLGDSMTPEDIADIARGEGGTKRIFEPIAKRAMQQIEHQLTTAEEQVTDGSVQNVLKRVRKLISGEMTPDAVVNELVGIFNDDKVVAAGQTLVQHSEHVLDVIEGVSGNKAVADAIQIAEKAGITKDSVMKEIEKIDVQKLIGTAGSAVTDEQARHQLVSSAIDTALDFALRVLPSMPVPPFEGVKDGLVYQISNLSMEGFRVRKEDIQIDLAGLRASRKTSSLPRADSGDSNETIQVEELDSTVKATELLIIDICNISAVLEKAVWSFEQTYMPYLKGNGQANVFMTGGAIRLQFELRRVWSKKIEKWEPVLCLHDRSCSIAEVELNLEGEGRLTWILNKLAAIFKGPLRDYVVRTIVRVLTNRSGWILKRLNEVLSPYWDLILRTAKLDMNDLVETDERVVLEETESSNDSLIELVWRETLPLGMNLLTNDTSGQLKVVDFPRGSQARVVCENRKLNPDLFEGATVVAVNGAQFDDAEELFDALREPGRPKTVRFRLAESSEIERIREFVDGGRPNEADGAKQKVKRNFQTRTVEIRSSGDIGIEFSTTVDNRALYVDSFLQHEDGIIFEAEKSGIIRVGDLLTHINGTLVVSSDGPVRAINMLRDFATTRPISLSFSDPYMYSVTVTKIPDAPGMDSSGGVEEIKLEKLDTSLDSTRIGVCGFEAASGMAETSGILLGDHLVFVNGTPVGAGCRWVEGGPSPSLECVLEMISDKSSYPIGLTFARPRLNERGWNSDSQKGGPLRDDQAETICVTASSEERIGCVLSQGHHGDITVSDFNGVAGIFQRSFTAQDGSRLPLPLTVESMNGQFVPSYASVTMVKNALKRSWKSENGVSLTLCDDELKVWIDEL